MIGTFLFFFLLFLNPILGGNFDPTRTRFIDWFHTGTGKTNYVFRGNEPLKDGKFALSDLVQSMNQVLQKSKNQTLPDKIYIIDFNLLSIEFTDWETEKEYFANNPSMGKFEHHPIIGSLLNPDWFPEPLRKIIAEDITGFDHLPKVMALIRQYLEASNSISNVIYIHCEAGKDRTGEVSGSYYITYLNWKFSEALYYDDHCVEGSRDIEEFSRNAFQWYCYYLYYGANSNLNCTIDPNYVGSC